MSGQQPTPENVISLADAYSVVTPDDNKRLYAKWATSYETSFVESNRYRYPYAVAEHFANVVPSSVGEYFVDVGCGTGIVGAHLASLRPTCRIDGIDISPEMIGQARQKLRSDSTPVYANLIETDLTQPQPALEMKYDAMLSAGTFTHGHLGPDAIAALLSLVRVGGWFVLGINAEHFDSRGFADVLLNANGCGDIAAPVFHKIQVYEEGSPHYGDQAVIATFSRIN